jgi:hypothetical protein
MSAFTTLRPFEKPQFERFDRLKSQPEADIKAFGAGGRARTVSATVQALALAKESAPLIPITAVAFSVQSRDTDNLIALIVRVEA